MSKTILLKLALLLIVCISQPASVVAQDTLNNLYLKAGIGIAFGQDDGGIIGDNWDPPDEVNFDFGQSTMYQIGIGYKINNYLTTELAIQNNSGFELEGPFIDDGVLLAGIDGEIDLETTSMLIGCQLDMATVFKKDWRTRPYLGIGVGYAQNKLGKFTFSEKYAVSIAKNTENCFAWKATLGATHKLTEHFSIDVSYSYADYGEAKTSKSVSNGQVLNPPLTFDVKANEVLFSLRYYF